MDKSNNNNNTTTTVTTTQIPINDENKDQNIDEIHIQTNIPQKFKINTSHSRHSRSRSRSPSKEHISKLASIEENIRQRPSNNLSHGPLMKIYVQTISPTMKDHLILFISRVATVSDFKRKLLSHGFNTHTNEDYILMVNNKCMTMADDTLLCVHAGIKSNSNKIIVQPKSMPIISTINKDKDIEITEVTTDMNDAIAKENEIKMEKAKETTNMDMYSAYVETFGEKEAAVLHKTEKKKIPEKQTNDSKASTDLAYYAALMGHSSIAQMTEKELLMLAHAVQSAAKQPTANPLTGDTEVPGTTHTAGGGTVSQPPPAHVNANACIFAGDLHPLVTRADLLPIFSQAGHVQWIQLFDCHQQMNRPFNFAFIYYEFLSEAKAAISTLNYTKFYRSPCRLMWKQEKNVQIWTDANVIIKNLPPNTDSQMLHMLFVKYGKILSSKVKTTATGRTLPYGYVQFEDRDASQRCIDDANARKIVIGANTLSVEYFKSRENRSFQQIYVKNIPNSWSDEALLNLFEAQTAGKIKSFNVKHSPFGRWACIAFHEPHHSVRQAIEKLNGCPTGDSQCPRLSVARFMYNADESEGNMENMGNVSNMNAFQRIGDRYSGRQPSSNNNKIDGCFSIYVGNIPLQLTEDHMRQLFEPFGAVISCATVQKTIDYKYGFVNFESANDAATAMITMNGKQIGGKTLQVKPANTDTSKAGQISRAAEYVDSGVGIGRYGSSYGQSQFGYGFGHQNMNNNMMNMAMGMGMNSYANANVGQFGGMSGNMSGNMNNMMMMGMGGMGTQNINNNAMSHLMAATAAANNAMVGQQMQQNVENINVGNKPQLSEREAKEILRDGMFEKVWKVQYGDDWHEYDITLAAIVERLMIGERIQITLADSNYIITRLSENEARQQNCASGTNRKVVRTQRKI